MIINHTADESSDVGGCIFRKQHLTIWQVFCVLNKEYFMLSVGWPGMRLATSFRFGFGVNDAFTANTLQMTHRDLILLGYICTVIGYVTASVNAYIIYPSGKEAP